MRILSAAIVLSLIASQANAGDQCHKSAHAEQHHTVYKVVKHTPHHEEAPQSDIVDTAVSAKSFGTLVAAVQAAELVDTLKGKGPFTVFAPTDEAFAKLPKGYVQSLLLPENKKELVAILTYHVVPGKVLASDAAKLSSAKTVSGEEAAIYQKGEHLMIDGAKIVATDIQATNGVIHVIDRVILP